MGYFTEEARARFESQGHCLDRKISDLKPEMRLQYWSLEMTSIRERIIISLSMQASAVVEFLSNEQLEAPLFFRPEESDNRVTTIKRVADYHIEKLYTLWERNVPLSALLNTPDPDIASAREFTGEVAMPEWVAKQSHPGFKTIKYHAKLYKKAEQAGKEDAREEDEYNAFCLIDTNFMRYYKYVSSLPLNDPLLVKMRASKRVEKTDCILQLFSRYKKACYLSEQTKIADAAMKELEEELAQQSVASKNTKQQRRKNSAPLTASGPARQIKRERSSSHISPPVVQKLSPLQEALFFLNGMRNHEQELKLLHFRIYRWFEGDPRTFPEYRGLPPHELRWQQICHRLPKVNLLVSSSYVLEHYACLYTYVGREGSYRGFAFYTELVVNGEIHECLLRVAIDPANRVFHAQLHPRTLKDARLTIESVAIPLAPPDLQEDEEKDDLQDIIVGRSQFDIDKEGQPLLWKIPPARHSKDTVLLRISKLSIT